MHRDHRALAIAIDDRWLRSCRCAPGPTVVVGARKEPRRVAAAHVEQQAAVGDLCNLALVATLQQRALLPRGTLVVGYQHEREDLCGLVERHAAAPAVTRQHPSARSRHERSGRARRQPPPVGRPAPRDLLRRRPGDAGVTRSRDEDDFVLAAEEERDLRRVVQRRRVADAGAPAVARLGLEDRERRPGGAAIERALHHDVHPAVISPLLAALRECEQHCTREQQRWDPVVGVALRVRCEQHRVVAQRAGRRWLHRLHHGLRGFERPVVHEERPAVAWEACLRVRRLRASERSWGG
eukprot:2782111-Prymnesium_polylepis.1